MDKPLTAWLVGAPKSMTQRSRFACRLQVDVQDRSGIRRVLRLTKVARHDQGARSCHSRVDDRVLVAVTNVPRAAVDIRDRREWPSPVGLADACQELPFSLPLIDHVGCFVHGRSPTSTKPLVGVVRG